MKSKLYIYILFLQFTSHSICTAQMIFAPPENTTVCRGNDVTISCGYLSATALPVTWIINGTFLTQEQVVETPLYQLNNPISPSIVSLMVFSINGTTTFQCVVLSTPNTISTRGTVTVTDIPVVETLAATSGCGYVTLSWTAYGESETCRIVQYNVTLSSVRSVTTDTRYIVIDTYNKSFNFTGLPNNTFNFTGLPNNTFNFTGLPNTFNFTGLPDNTSFNSNILGIINMAGLTNPSSTFVRTPSPTPVMVKASVSFTVDTFVITLTWQASFNCTVNIKRYDIIIKDQFKQAKVKAPANTSSVEITGNGVTIIGANKEYTIIVSAVSNRKYPSDPIYISTFILQNCSVTSPSNGIIRVSCDSPHQILISACTNNCYNVKMTSSGYSPLIIRGLDPGIMYSVTINVFDGNQVVVKDETVTKTVTVMGDKLNPPNQPQFTQCITYSNGHPSLQVLSYVTVDIQMMSLLLIFSASYQTGNSNSQSTICSLLSDMQYNCTAEFAVDIIPSVDTIESVNVTVCGSYGSASSRNTFNSVVRVILNVTEDVYLTSATLTCTLPCFSPNIQSSLFRISANNANVMNTITNVISPVDGSVVSYSYPTQNLVIDNLILNTTYTYCVGAINMITKREVGKPLCGNFKTPNILALKRCTITSPSVKTIRISCELLEVFTRISVTISSNSCTCSQPITVVDNNPITVSDLPIGVYTVGVTAVNSNDMNVEYNGIIETITVLDSQTLPTATFPTVDSDKSTSPTVDFDKNTSSNDSEAATIAITSIVTLLVSVTVTAVISSIIMYMFMKRKYDHEDTPRDVTTNKVLYEEVDSSKLFATNDDPNCQKNPAYGLGKAVMDTSTGPTYEFCK